MLEARAIFDALAFLPHRQPGSEEADLARDILRRILEDEMGATVVEHGYLLPARWQSIWLPPAVLALATLWSAAIHPVLIGITVLLLIVAGLAILDGRAHLLASLAGRHPSASLHASKGHGAQRIILTADFDSENRGRWSPLAAIPAAWRVWAGAGCWSAACLALVMLGGQGLTGQLIGSALVIGCVLVTWLWPTEEDRGWHTALTAVSVAVSAAGRLWSDPRFAGTKVELVVTSGRSIGGVGAVKVLRQAKAGLAGPGGARPFRPLGPGDWLIECRTMASGPFSLQLEEGRLLPAAAAPAVRLAVMDAVKTADPSVFPPIALGRLEGQMISGSACLGFWRSGLQAAQITGSLPSDREKPPRAPELTLATDRVVGLVTLLALGSR